MRHLDEGTIHAWLDGALDAEESRAVETHLAECSSCADEVAEARGLIAASSRILSVLDAVPGAVIPDDATVPPTVAAAASPSRMPPARGAATGGAARRRRLPASVRVAAAMMLVTAGAITITRMERVPRHESAKVATASGPSAAAPVADAMRTQSGAAVSPAPSAPTAMARKRVVPAPAPAPRRDYARTEERFAPSLAAPERQAPGTPGGSTSVDTGISNALAAKAPVVRLRGESRILSSDGTRIALVAGRVANEGGTPIAHASVIATAGGITRGALTDSAGRYAITLPESLVDRPVALTARIIGYRQSTDTVVPSRTATVRRDFTLPSTPLALSEMIATGQGTTTRDSAAARARPVLVRSDSVVEEGRMVRRTIYAVRPGVRVTLEEAAAIADHQAAVDARDRDTPSRPAPARAPTQSEDSLAAGINSIHWTAADGTRCTLSGRLPVEELEKLRELLR